MMMRSLSFGRQIKKSLLITSSSSSVRRPRSFSSSSSWRFQQQKQLSSSSNNCRILLAGCHFQGGYHYLKQQQRDILTNQQQQKLEFVLAPTPDSIRDLAPTVDVAIPFMEKFDATFFERATRLKLSIQYGVGLEGVDIEAATKAGVVVSNVPASQTGNAQATSEHALYLTMSLLRNKNDILQQRFQKQILGGIPMPQSIFGKNVTVVGYGNVGRVLCHYFQTMGANVTVVRRNQSWDDDENDTTNDNKTTTITTTSILNRANSLQEVLPTTQILVLACTMTPETYHIINDKTISLLPSGGESIIVNVGRGPLVEYNAILKALDDNKIAGFASDVGISCEGKPSEPWDPSDKLSKHPNTIFTPHVGGYTDYSYQQMANRILIAIKQVVLEGKPPPVWVNNSP